MFEGNSCAGPGRQRNALCFSKITLAVLLAAFAAGCAHSNVAGMSQPHTTGAVPRDAWGNPIVVSENTR
jgi:hypothetical protein